MSARRISSMSLSKLNLPLKDRIPCIFLSLIHSTTARLTASVRVEAAVKLIKSSNTSSGIVTVVRMLTPII